MPRTLLRQQSVPWVALLFGLLSACAHTPRGGSLESLRTAADTFHQRVRWRDYRGAAELVVPERRVAFERARVAQHDDRDLTITDFQLEDARLGAEGRRAVVVSRIQWLRLPSVTEHTAVVTSEFVYRQGVWFLARQDAGPFTPELQAPLPLLPDGGLSD